MNGSGMGAAVGLAKAAVNGAGAIPDVLKALYNMGERVDDFIDDHIAGLKSSENLTISTTGRVLEAAKFGFGMGYSSSLAIIATGQLMLGNPLAAATVVAQGVTLTNPIAMTCAAVGAIYYGWSALSEKEREAILERLTKGFQIGVEIIKAMIEFVIRTTKEFLSSKQLAEFKTFIAAQAEAFGRSLYDVTHSVGDLVRGAANAAAQIATNVADAASSAAASASEAASGAATRVGERIKQIK